MELDALDDTARFTEWGLRCMFGELVDCDGSILTLGRDCCEIVATTMPANVLDGVLDANNNSRTGVLLGW